MKISVSGGGIQDSTADTIILNLFEGVSTPGGATGAVDRVLDGAISELIAGGDLSGQAGEVHVLYPRGAMPARRVLVAGLGTSEALDLEGVRRAAAAAIQRARELNAHQVATIVHGGGTAGLTIEEAAQATLEGSLLALYRYKYGEQSRQKKDGIETLTIVEFDEGKHEQIRRAARAAEAIAAGVNLARNLVNMPPNIATPSRLAEVAQDIARAHQMEITVGDREWAAELGMGAFLAVAKGAGEPPKFIVLEHNPGREDLDTIILVGKGITFDSGGITLKAGEKMSRMKSDMAGAAAVLASMQIAGQLALPVHLIAIAPCTENMPDGNSYHPADVITASNGKTIEIISTDAEGRMVLADALVYASRYHPKAVVDLATLTSSCVIALGTGVVAGLFSNDDRLRDRLLASAQATHERLWTLPLWEDYRKKIYSDVADMKNSGGQYGGIGASAVFLKEFTNYPWAHIDMAAMALTDKEEAYIPAGGTGYGVRLLADFLRNWTSS